MLTFALIHVGKEKALSVCPSQTTFRWHKSKLSSKQLVLFNLCLFRVNSVKMFHCFTTNRWIFCLGLVNYSEIFRKTKKSSFYFVILVIICLDLFNDLNKLLLKLQSRMERHKQTEGMTHTSF